MASYEQITIKGHTFQVPVRYQEGHTCSAGDASTLNQALHNNLRNNFSKKVETALKDGGNAANLQAELTAYANSYQLGAHGGGPRSAKGSRGDPAHTLALDAARSVVRDAIKKNGLNEADWPPPKVAKAAADLLKAQGDAGTLITMARAAVTAKREAAQAAMASINEVLAAQT